MSVKQIMFLVIGIAIFLFIANEWSRKDSYTPTMFGRLQHTSDGEPHNVPMGGMMAQWSDYGTHHTFPMGSMMGHHAIPMNHHVGGPKQIYVTSMNYTNGQTPTIMFDNANQPLTLNKSVTLVITNATASYEDGPKHINVPYPVTITGIWVSGSIGPGMISQGINPTTLSHAASVFISKMAGSPYGGSSLANITGFLYQN